MPGTTALVSQVLLVSRPGLAEVISMSFLSTVRAGELWFQRSAIFHIAEHCLMASCLAPVTSRTIPLLVVGPLRVVGPLLVVGPPRVVGPLLVVGPLRVVGPLLVVGLLHGC